MVDPGLVPAGPDFKPSPAPFAWCSMSALALLQSPALYELLVSFDDEMTEKLRSRGCPHCGGPLYRADYLRKPRVVPVELAERLCVRRSLCCGREGCRRRVQPPSCLFWGRRVYLAPIIWFLVALREHRGGGRLANRICAQLGLSQSTFRRWSLWFRKIFPTTPGWRRLEPKVALWIPADGPVVGPTMSLWFETQATAELALARCLKFLKSSHLPP